MTTENFFYLNILGQIQSAHYPLGPQGSGIFCRYDVVVGNDWELVSGIKAGITQCANGGVKFEDVVFNMPIECTFKSTNVYGWPQIVFSFYGTNRWGTEINLGYARIHVPCNVINERKSELQILRAPIVTPKATNIWASMINLITDRTPELRDPKILANGTKTKNLFTSSYGEILISLESIMKGTEKLAFDC
ncbi:unnamed protein product [Diamesa serratosioi]